MAYWRYLSFVLNEVEEVVLFGYSGEDKHLNELLRVYKDKVKFRVHFWDLTIDYLQTDNAPDSKLGAHGEH